MASPVPHDTGTGHSNTGSFTISLANVAAGDTLVLLFNSINTNNVYSTVTSITGVGGTWHLRAQDQFQFSAAAADKSDAEVWWNNTPSSTGSVTITVNYVNSGTVDTAAGSVFRVTGCDPTNPWDGNVSLPAFSQNNTGSPSALTNTISTTDADDLLLNWNCNQSSPTSNDPTNGGWSHLLTNSDTQGAWGSYNSVSYISKSATLSSYAVHDGNSKVHEHVWTDALTADSSTAYTNTQIINCGV